MFYFKYKSQLERTLTSNEQGTYKINTFPVLIRTQVRRDRTNLPTNGLIEMSKYMS